MPVPLIAAAFGAGAIRAGLGMVGANQQKQRNKGRISQQYRQGLERQKTNQQDVSRSHLEALNARGLVSGRTGTARTSAMVGTEGPAVTSLKGMSPSEAMRALKASKTATYGADAIDAAYRSAPARTLGEQERSTLRDEFTIERRDLDTARDNAMQDNRDAYSQALLSNAAAGIDTGMQVYGMGKAMSEGGTTPSTDTLPDIGGANPQISGAFGLDPLAPTLAQFDRLYGSGTVIGGGQPNYAFRVGS